MLLDFQLERLRSYYRKNGNLPTYDEMRNLFRYKSKSTVYYKVNRMIRNGVLRRKNHKLLPGRRFMENPYFQSVRAGFPSPAEEEANDRISLDQLLIDKPNSTLLIRVKGESMIGLGIMPGDIVVVERTPDAKPGQIVVVNLEGEFTVKTLRQKEGALYLESAHPDYPTFPMAAYTHHALVGVVQGVARKYSNTALSSER